VVLGRYKRGFVDWAGRTPINYHYLINTRNRIEIQMNITIDNKTFDTTTMKYRELQELRKQVKEAKLSMTAQLYGKVMKHLNERVADLADSDEVSVREVFTMVTKTLDIEGGDRVSFWPGVSIDHVNRKDGLGSVLQSRLLSKEQGWAWGSFVLTIGNLIVVCGKVSKSVVKVDGKFGYRVSFDYESSRLIDIAAMMKGTLMEHSSRHETNQLATKVREAFTEAYPELLDEKGRAQVRVEAKPPRVEKTCLFPLGEQREQEAKARRDAKAAEILARGREAMEAEDELAKLGLGEVGLE